MVIVEVGQAIIDWVAGNTGGDGLPGNGEGDAHGGVAGGAFHFVAREREVGGDAARLHRLGADAVGVVGKRRGAAAAGGDAGHSQR